MSRRNLIFAALCVGAALVCARLGVWQLSRLEERRERNALVRGRLALPPVDVATVPADPGERRFRRVAASGVYDYSRELALAGRSRDGSPGVYIVTPLRRPGRDTVVLVERGWVYSPDASTVNFAEWRERDTVAVQGFVNELPAAGRGAVQVGTQPRSFRWLDPAIAERAVGAPVAPYLLVAQGDTAGTGANRIPVRLEPPPLDEGSHWNYAVQWFAFAGVSLAGLAAFLTSERRRGR